jgi:hypothetical protein
MTDERDRPDRPAIHSSEGVRLGETVAGPLELSLAQARMVQCRIDHALSLVLDGDQAARVWVVRIEGPFSIVGHDRPVESFGSDGPPSSWGPAIDVLLHAVVLAATVSADGTLTLQLEGGRAVKVPAMEQWEAWKVTGPGDALVVCGPDGQLSRWGAPPDMSMLPDDVRAGARVRENGEVEWRLAHATRAINGLADAGLVVLGLDLRSYPGGKTFEVPWSSFEPGDSTDREAADAGRHAALNALARENFAEHTDHAEWILVTWR